MARLFNHCSRESTKMLSVFFPHSLRDYRKKILNTKYKLRLPPQLMSEIFLILRRIQRDLIINVNRSSCKVLLILFRFSFKFNFHHSFAKNTGLPNFNTIDQLDAELIHLTDTMNLMVIFLAVFSFEDTLH